MKVNGLGGCLVLLDIHYKYKQSTSKVNGRIKDRTHQSVLHYFLADWESSWNLLKPLQQSCLQTCS